MLHSKNREDVDLGVMHQIDMQHMSEAFFACWEAAGLHLDRQVDGGIRSWGRAHPYPPFLEHLSFRLGNQLFFVRVEDASGWVQGPGDVHGLLRIAEQCRGHACMLPMTASRSGKDWVADRPGWGLLDAHTGKAINPAALVTDELIVMSPWEVQHVAVQVVRDHLDERGFEIMSWQSDPATDPSIWFVGESKGPEWVVVRSASSHQGHAPPPQNWAGIAQVCVSLSTTGHFASVCIESAQQVHAAPTDPAIPLWRGHGMHVDFRGLITPTRN